MKFSEGGQDKILAALLEARKRFEPVLKSRTATIKTDKGQYSYPYAALGDVQAIVTGPLLDNDLMLTFDPDVVAGTLTATGDEVGRRVHITALLEHKSGQWRSEILQLPYAKASPGMNVYQAIGAIVTYGSRILTAAILGIASVDNDTVGIEGQNERNGQELKAENREPIKAPQAVKDDTVDLLTAATQMLSETFEVGGKMMSAFLADEKAARYKKISAAAGNAEAMKTVHDAIVAEVESRRTKIEGGNHGNRTGKA